MPSPTAIVSHLHDRRLQMPSRLWKTGKHIHARMCCWITILTHRRSAPGEAAAEAADGHADDAVNEIQRHGKV